MVENKEAVKEKPGHYKLIPEGKLADYEAQYGSSRIKVFEGKLYWADYEDQSYKTWASANEVKKAGKKAARKQREAEAVARAEVRAHNDFRSEMSKNLTAQRAELLKKLDSIKEMRNALPERKEMTSKKGSTAAVTSPATVSPTEATKPVSK